MHTAQRVAHRAARDLTNDELTQIMLNAMNDVPPPRSARRKVPTRVFHVPARVGLAYKRPNFEGRAAAAAQRRRIARKQAQARAAAVAAAVHA